jgi:hypothetical protein
MPIGRFRLSTPPDAAGRPCGGRGGASAIAALVRPSDRRIDGPAMLPGARRAFPPAQWQLEDADRQALLLQRNSNSTPDDKFPRSNQPQYPSNFSCVVGRRGGVGIAKFPTRFDRRSDHFLCGTGISERCDNLREQGWECHRRFPKSHGCSKPASNIGLANGLRDFFSKQF